MLLRMVAITRARAALTLRGRAASLDAIRGFSLIAAHVRVS